MTQDEMKRLAALAALDYVEGGIIGVGTGSTVNPKYKINSQTTTKTTTYTTFQPINHSL